MAEELTKFNAELLALLEKSVARKRQTYSFEEVYKPAQVMTLKDGARALDACCEPSMVWNAFAPAVGPLQLPCYITPFIGYPYIAQLRQDMIYQNIIGTYAEEMTYRWLELLSGDEEKVPAEKLKEIQDAALNKWKLDSFVKDAWKTYFGWDGGGLVFIDIKGHTSDEQLASELIIDKEHIGKGDLLGFRPVEAINCQAYDYDAVNPLSPDYFNPRYWLILGKKVHRSRFLHFTQNKLPSLLKPVYNFMGVPWVQMLEPYRNGFERARQASLDSIENHALLYLKTSLQKMLSYGCNEPGSLQNRVKLMEMMRTNSGIGVCDKDTEEFQQITTPLTDLDDNVTLNLELLAMVTRLPVTKMFGTPPKGLDASGDNYKTDRAETVAEMQMDILHDNVVKMYELIQLSEFGEIYRPIQYHWLSTLEQTQDEKLEADLKQAQIDQIYLGDSPFGPVLHPEEVRQRLSKDRKGKYSGIETSEDGSVYYEELEERENEKAEAEAQGLGEGGADNGAIGGGEGTVPEESEGAAGADEERYGKPTIQSRSPRAARYIEKSAPEMVAEDSGGGKEGRGLVHGGNGQGFEETRQENARGK